MNTLQNKYDAIENLIFRERLRMESLAIETEKDLLVIHLNNQLTVTAPISFFKRLKGASPTALRHFKFVANGTGIHWPELDEDLSLKGLLEEFLRQRVNSASQLSII
ncbi:MAG TPA: DUF2442 domain-containing protein [Chitinophagaceae bacterium]